MRKLFFFFLFSRIIYITLFWLFFLLFRKIRYGLGFNLGKNWLGHRLDLPLSCHRALTWWVQWRPNGVPPHYSTLVGCSRACGCKFMIILGSLHDWRVKTNGEKLPTKIFHFSVNYVFGGSGALETWTDHWVG